MLEILSFTTENSNKFQKSRFWKEKSVENVVTLGPTAQVTLVYIKRYLKAKEELWKFKYFTMQKYNGQKNPLEEAKILQDIVSL
jgi:hypothetical protein